MYKTPILLYKKRGETPLECQERFRLGHPEYVDARFAYAGRLDPLAEGLLVVLAGDGTGHRKAYERMEKRYTVDVLFGVSTDSHDPMGLPVLHDIPQKSALETALPAVFREMTRTFRQPYPPFSAARVGGHPLYWWARNGRLDEIVIPEKEVTIRSIDVISYGAVTMESLAADTVSVVSRIRGEFRQQEIIAAWKSLPDAGGLTFPVVRLDISCSSGTYMRSLAHELGQRLHTGALAARILRTRVGPYRVEDTLP